MHKTLSCCCFDEVPCVTCYLPSLSSRKLGDFLSARWEMPTRKWKTQICCIRSDYTYTFVAWFFFSFSTTAGNIGRWRRIFWDQQEMWVIVLRRFFDHTNNECHKIIFTQYLSYVAVVYVLKTFKYIYLFIICYCEIPNINLMFYQSISGYTHMNW